MKQAVCYLCGKEGADSSDHIPPKNIFFKKTTDLITAPAHINCNKAWEKDDEYFRFSLVNMAYGYSREAQLLFKEKVVPRFHSPKKWKFKKALLKDFMKLQGQSPSGSLLDGQHAIGIDAKRVGDVIKRVARGLYFKRHGEVFPADFPMHISLIERSIMIDRHKILASKHFKSVGDGVFRYAYLTASEDKRYSYFWFTFFDCIDFTIFASDKDIVPENAQGQFDIYV